MSVGIVRADTNRFFASPTDLRGAGCLLRVRARCGAMSKRNLFLLLSPLALACSGGSNLGRLDGATGADAQEGGSVSSDGGAGDGGAQGTGDQTPDGGYSALDGSLEAFCKGSGAPIQVGTGTNSVTTCSGDIAANVPLRRVHLRQCPDQPDRAGG